MYWCYYIVAPLSFAFGFNFLYSCVQVQKLQQKLHIMTEMYQENELKLHRYRHTDQCMEKLQVRLQAWLMNVCVCRLLTVEEKERLQKEEKLNKADKNIALAMEELNNYRYSASTKHQQAHVWCLLASHVQKLSHTCTSPSLQTTSRGDGGRAGENQTVLPDSNISTWEESSQ